MFVCVLRYFVWYITAHFLSSKEKFYAIMASGSYPKVIHKTIHSGSGKYCSLAVMHWEK